jgi:hypothetical protein
MECFYGDAYLCKVEKRDVDFDNIPSFKVTSVCNDVGVFDLFYDEYLPRRHTVVSILNVWFVSIRFYCVFFGFSNLDFDDELI